MSHFQWHFFIDFLDFFHKNFIWGALSNVLTILEIAYILTESQGMIYTLPMAIMLFYWSVRTLNKKFHERFLCVVDVLKQKDSDLLSGRKGKIVLELREGGAKPFN